MKKIATLCVLLTMAGLMACATTDSSRHREGDNTGQDVAMTVEDEKRLTEEALPQMRKDYPAAQNAELQKYIDGLGQKIVKANKLDGQPYHYTFTVVDVENVNAFAMPAGQVFVMGDHRSVSVDSRSQSVGTVALSEIVGRVEARIWPAERIGGV